MTTDSKKERVQELFGEAGKSETPTKKQKTLGFKVLSPEEKAHKETTEVAEYIAAKGADEATKKSIEEAKQHLAEAWGIPWPQPEERGPSRRGGPTPRATK